jgi:hypothetical protein
MFRELDIIRLYTIPKIAHLSQDIIQMWFEYVIISLYPNFWLCVIQYVSCGSAVGTVTAYGLNDWEVQGSSPEGHKF